MLKDVFTGKQIEEAQDGVSLYQTSNTRLQADTVQNTSYAQTSKTVTESR